MNQLDTASHPLTVQSMSVLVLTKMLVIKIRDPKGLISFIYRAPCLYVPDLQSDQLLSYSQMATCNGCEISCKCLSSNELDQTITTRDAKNRLRKVKIIRPVVILFSDGNLQWL